MMSTMFKKRLIPAIILMACVMPLVLHAVEYDNEYLSYRATYKWGFIQKVAGDASLTLRHDPDGYHAILTAKTRPWADPIFSVRDTLTGRMRNGDMAPVLYDKTTHEGGKYGHDVITYTYAGNTATAHCTRYKLDKKGRETTSEITLSAKEPAVDMLSVYYFVRRLPFESMKPGTVSRATIFSGKKKENLALTFEGIENVKLDGHTYECYRVSFTFSVDRLQNSSAPMRAWIRTDGTRIPIKLEGELTIGKIQVLWNRP